MTQLDIEEFYDDEQLEFVARHIFASNIGAEGEWRDQPPKDQHSYKMIAACAIDAMTEYAKRKKH